MSITVITKGLVRLGGYDLTGQTNKIAASYGAQALDSTVLGNVTKVSQGGLKTTKVSVAGFWGSTDDKAIFNDIGLKDILTFGLTSTEGGIVFTQAAMQAQYTPVTGQVGKLQPYTLTAEAEGDLIRCTLIANKTAIAATAHGTGFQLGAVSAGQNIWAALHVTNITGTGVTLAGIVESSVDNTFASPTTRITFANVTDVTGVGAQLLSAAGAITDQWWRFTFTISGTGTFDFTCAAGIQ